MKLGDWLDAEKERMEAREDLSCDNPIFWFALREYRAHLGLEPDPELEAKLTKSPLGMLLVYISYAFDGGKEQ